MNSGVGHPQEKYNITYRMQPEDIRALYLAALRWRRYKFLVKASGLAAFGVVAFAIGVAMIGSATGRARLADVLADPAMWRMILAFTPLVVLACVIVMATSL